MRHFLGIQQALDYGELDNVFHLPWPGNTVGGPTEVKSDKAPLLRMLQSSPFRPGTLCPPRGVTFVGRPTAFVIYLYFASLHNPRCVVARVLY